MAYPHEELVKAWLAGKKIQFKDPVKDIWLDIEDPDDADKMPHFYRHGTEYRIKPTFVRYRVGMVLNGNLIVANSMSAAKNAESSRDFVRWISDWHETQV